MQYKEIDCQILSGGCGRYYIRDFAEQFHGKFVLRSGEWSLTENAKWDDMVLFQTREEAEVFVSKDSEPPKKHKRMHVPLF